MDSIKPGANFRQVIEDTFTKCGAVIVLIGKRWLERDAGMPRFGEEQDVITQEVRLAMGSNLPILPVLVDGASMPGESQLPATLASLSSLNAIDLRHTSFDRDLQAVTDHLVETLGGAKETMIEKLALKLYGPFSWQLHCKDPRRDRAVFCHGSAVGARRTDRGGVCFLAQRV